MVTNRIRADSKGLFLSPAKRERVNPRCRAGNQGKIARLPWEAGLAACKGAQGL